jgi:hypothetical protein
MSDAKAQIGASEEWCIFLLPRNQPLRNQPLQPYRSAPTAWPISAEELTLTEVQSAASNASALNNLGTWEGVRHIATATN